MSARDDATRLSQPPAASRGVGCHQRDPNATVPLPARAGNGEQFEFPLRRERSADILRFRERFVILADEVPELELLQLAAQDSDLDVDGAIPGTFRLAPCDITSASLSRLVSITVGKQRVTFVTYVSALGSFILA